MILGIDIGNTSTKIAFIENNKIKTLSSFITKKDILFLEKKLEIFFSKNYKTPKGLPCLISSVVPGINNMISNIFEEKYSLKPKFIDYSFYKKIYFNVEKPGDIGSDRICDIAYTNENFNGSSIIINCGTATVFNLLYQNKEFVGGLIAPGIETSHRSLFLSAEKLKKSKLLFPDKIINKTTDENISSGVLFGHLSMIESLIEKIRDEVNFKIENIILTGGYAKMIFKKSKFFTSYKENTTLLGIEHIANYYL